LSKGQVDSEREAYEELGRMQILKCEKGSEQDMQDLQRCREQLGEEFLVDLEMF